jgi:hypothetical protein
MDSIVAYFLKKSVKSFSLFYNSTGLKWFVATSFFILNFFSYYQNPILFTNLSNCYGLPCRWFNLITGILNLTLNLIGIIGLWYCAPFTQYLPDYWYIPLAILSYAVIIQITLSVKTTIDDGKSLNPPPQNLWPKLNRTILQVVITILDVIFFHQMYLDGGKQLVNNPRVLDNFILGRFGGWNESKFEFLLGWWGIIGLIIDVLTIIQVYSFQSCDYDLPPSWDY